MLKAKCSFYDHYQNIKEVILKNKKIISKVEVEKFFVKDHFNDFLIDLDIFGFFGGCPF